MSLTIVIPTRNRINRVLKLIESFVTIKNKDFLWSVLIIDNASTDGTKIKIKKIKDNFFFKIQYFYEKKVGLHYARNAAINLVKTDYMVFLDDDMVVSDTWLDDFNFIKKNKTDAFVGKITPLWEDSPPIWLKLLIFGGTYPYLGLLNLGEKIVKIDPLYLYGGNLFIKKKILIKLEGFHPDGFPNELIRYRGDGESGLMKKFKLKKYRSHYVPSANVFHIINRDRFSFDYLCKRAFNEGISASFASFRETKISLEKKKKRLYNFFNAIFSSRIIQLIIQKFFLFPLDKKLKYSFIKGFMYHQNEVKNDKKLLDYVLKKNYL
jgi:glycosyltransferase involved in cell wall biosynthesis